MRTSSARLCLTTALTSLLCIGRAEATPPPVADDLAGLIAATSWSSAGNGPSDNHYQPFEFALGRQTMRYLAPRCVFTARGEVQGTPSVEGGMLYATDNGGSIWRINAVTGKAIWETKLPSLSGIATSYSWVTPAIAPDVIIVGDQASATVFAISKATGALVWKTTLATNLTAFITASPVVLNGRVYVGVSSDQEVAAAEVPGFKIDFRGSAAALDLRTGGIIWQTYTMPVGYTGGAV